jgi:hypothetical protein
MYRQSLLSKIAETGWAPTGFEVVIRQGVREVQGVPPDAV